MLLKSPRKITRQHDKECIVSAQRTKQETDKRKTGKETEEKSKQG